MRNEMMSIALKSLKSLTNMALRIHTLFLDFTLIRNKKNNTTR